MNKIKSLNEFLKNRLFESDSEDDDYYYVDDEDQGDSEDSDEVSYLKYLIRKLFNGNDLDVDVEIDPSGDEISVFAFLDKKEKINSLLNLFDSALKLKKDILPQFKLNFELYSNKNGDPIFQFTFELNKNPKKVIKSVYPDDDFEDEIPF